ncbi:max dimerization protein 1-like isoform X1 [Vespula maculifrons]|uniref:Max dimerization protein 1-like isoform X1 n=1 Tax=Vespula maculifrons TaxID=7453 RepID=A0ABD2CNA8_VESMC
MSVERDVEVPTMSTMRKKSKRENETRGGWFDEEALRASETCRISENKRDVLRRQGSTIKVTDVFLDVYEVDVIGYTSNQSDTDDHSSVQSSSDSGVAMSTSRLTLSEMMDNL